MDFKINNPKSADDPANSSAPQEAAPAPQEATPAPMESQSPAVSDEDILKELAREKAEHAAEAVQTKEAAREQFKEKAKAFFPRMIKRLGLLAAEKPKHFAVLILAVVVGVVAIASIPSIALGITRSQAVSAFEKGDFSAAAKSLGFYTSHREDDLDALHMLGVAYIKIGMQEEANAIFSDLLLNPNYTDDDADFHYYHGLAVLPIRSDAVKRLDLAIANDPTHLPSLVARGFLIGEQPIQQSIADFEKALRIANALTVENQLDARDDLSELHHFLLRANNQLFQPLRPLQNVSLPPLAGEKENPLIGLGSFDNRYGYGLAAATKEGKEIRSKTLTLLYYSLLLFEIAEYEKAEMLLREASELQPGVELVSTTLAAAMAVRGDYAGAAKLYAQIAEHLPNDAGTLVNLANARLAGGGDEAEVAEIYTRALAIAKDHFIALNNRGLLKMRTEDLDGAAADFEAAITAAGAALPPRYNIAILRWRRGETAEAIEELKRVAADDTAFGGVLSVLGRLYSETGDSEESLKALARHRKLYPADPEPYLVSAELHRKHGNDLLAENMLKAGLKNAPDNAPLSLELAGIYATTDRVKEAAALLDNVSESDAVSDAGLRLVKGDILWQGGDKQGGLTEYRLAYKSATGDKERLAASIRLGRALIETGGKDDEINTVIETGFSADPANPDLKILQAKSLIAQKRITEALVYATEAAEAAPNRADLNVEVGDIFSEAKRSRKALSYYRKALELSPGDEETLSRVLAMQRAIGDTAGAEETAAQLRRIRGEYTASTEGGNAASGSDVGRQLEADINRTIFAANAAAQKKDYDQAIHLFKEAAFLYTELIDRYGEKVVWLQQRGLIRLNLQDYENAIPDFEKLLRIGGDEALPPENLRAVHLNLAAAYTGIKEFTRAADAYSKAIELNPQAGDMVDLMFRRGIAYLQAKKFEQALADFDRAIELKPNFEKAYFRRGTIFLRQEKYPNAITEFTKSIQINPKSVNSYRARAQAYDLMGDETGKALQDRETAKSISASGG